MPHELHLRPALIASGIALLSWWLASELKTRRGKPAWPSRSQLERLHARIEAHYPALLALLTGGFALLASLAKLSQLRALALNAEDFWLFQDLLAQMSRGGFFITRYAPQAQGWVQHGIVHPMLSWMPVVPLAWLAGPTAAALLFGPLVLAGAAWTLAAIARPRTGATGALLMAAAFLASNQVGRVLMYDVHPEAAYPLGVFAWAWAAGWGGGKLRPLALLASTALLMGIKEDSFAVLPPLIAATALLRRDISRRWLAASAALALAVCLAQFYSVHEWASGAWGPHEWRGAPVVLPRGSGPMRDHHWDTLSSASAIFSETVGERGGALAIAWGLIRFLFSRPWLSLLLVAPWVALQPAFWISALPLAGVYSLLDDPAKFINYYSAPALGLFWLAATRSPFKSLSYPLWVLCASLVLGGAGIDFYLQSEAIVQTRQEVQALLTCLPANGGGIVSGRFIGLIPEEKILSDRIPLEENFGNPGFYLFSTRLPSYEIPPVAAQSLLERLQKDPHWNQLGTDCRVIGAPTDSAVLLFVRRAPSSD
jgi:hypothetical protein